MNNSTEQSFLRMTLLSSLPCFLVLLIFSFRFVPFIIYTRLAAGSSRSEFSTRPNNLIPHFFHLIGPIAQGILGLDITG
jgi:hypothetical protein